MMQNIRRFDIFAIFNKVSKENEMDEKHAKGYGIWMARFIAGRRFGAKATKPNGKKGSKTAEKKATGVQSWYTLNGKPQTDKEYDNELLKRFGSANLIALEKWVKDAYIKGVDYKTIRDCKHGHGWCAECSKDFRKVFKNILGHNPKAVRI